jgi:hypothetical protein
VGRGPSVTTMSHIDIDPVSVVQVRRSRTGRKVAIGDDVANVARDLRDIDPRFRLFYNEDERVFVVELHEEGVEHLVGVYRELDQRIVARARRFTRPDFDLAAEIENSEAEAAAAEDARRAEQLGDASQRLHHALRTDLGRHEIGQTLKSRAFIPRAYRRLDAPDDPAR